MNDSVAFEEVLKARLLTKAQHASSRERAEFYKSLAEELHAMIALEVEFEELIKALRETMKPDKFLSKPFAVDEDLVDYAVDEMSTQVERLKRVTNWNEAKASLLRLMMVSGEFFQYLFAELQDRE